MVAKRWDSTDRTAFMASHLLQHTGWWKQQRKARARLKTSGFQAKGGFTGPGSVRKASKKSRVHQLHTKPATDCIQFLYTNGAWLARKMRRQRHPSKMAAQA